MTSMGLELMIPAAEYLKTYILDNTDTRTWATPYQYKKKQPCHTPSTWNLLPFNPTALGYTKMTGRNVNPSITNQPVPLLLMDPKMYNVHHFLNE
jgi:hypothetical protein